MVGLKKRRLFSVKTELIRKGREAALAAVQIYNNPSVTFKAEIYIVTMVIAWTYILHAYFRGKKIDYRYYRTSESGRKLYDKTARGAFKFWELERCLNDKYNPLDHITSENLRFLIGLRHEIEHQMTTRIDDLLSARFQACCLNFNAYIKQLFGSEYGIDRHLSFSLQFARMSQEHISSLGEHKDLPAHILKFIEGFDGQLSPEEFNSPKFGYRALFVAKTANNRGQADEVVEFLRPDNPITSDINIKYAMVKEQEKPKFRPSTIVEKMQSEGYPGFTMHSHIELWKGLDGKNPQKNMEQQLKVFGIGMNRG